MTGEKPIKKNRGNEKEPALRSPVKLAPEEKEAAKEMIRKIIAEVTDRISDPDIKGYSVIQDYLQ